jgi:hypothetical protein
MDLRTTSGRFHEIRDAGTVCEPVARSILIMLVPGSRPSRNYPLGRITPLYGQSLPVFLLSHKGCLAAANASLVACRRSKCKGCRMGRRCCLTWGIRAPK